MPESPIRAVFRQRLCAAANEDARFIGFLIGGSGSDGRLDEWSDLDATFFLKDEDFDAFMQEWQSWAIQFGDMVLAYDPIGFPTTYWTIYHTEGSPLRVEYKFQRESQIEDITTLRTSPQSVEAMVCCDKTGGRLSACVSQLVGQDLSLPASEEQQVFKDRCDQLWYNLLYSFNKLQRGHQWYARMAFHIGTLDSLMALLKLEAHAVERWQATFPSWNLEQMIPEARLVQLNECIPAEGVENLRQAMIRATLLGREVCQSLATMHDWMWPERAPDEILSALTNDPGR
jgi:hypothetical protein